MAARTYTANISLLMTLYSLPKQDMPENGGISDQKFYCGPEGAAFDYNEFVLPYVGVVIMFFSVVYSRYRSTPFLSCFFFFLSFFPQLFDKCVYSFGRLIAIQLPTCSLGTSADSAVALGVTGHRRGSERNAERTEKSSSCLPSCCEAPDHGKLYFDSSSKCTLIFHYLLQ